MKKLDLNALQRPTLDLTLRDDKHTEVHMTLPSTKLIERLLAIAPDLSKVAKNADVESIKALYGLAADLISNNTDGLTFTAEELRDIYGVRFEDLFFIFPAYLEFVNEVQSAKN
jgi:hypothetical protein